MSIEAMKQALDALRLLVEERSYEAMDDGYKAITALRAAIEQAEKQEPVAFNAGVPLLYPEMKDGETISAEYVETPPPAAQQEPFSPDAIQTTQTAWKLGYEAAKAEAQPAPVSDPVAWMVYTLDGQSVCVTDNPADFGESHRTLPLYTTPPAAQRQPVLEDIEQYRLQMAGISTAATGYWKEGDGIHSDYDTLALRDVAKLYAKYDALYKAAQRKEWQGLTDEEIKEIIGPWGDTPIKGYTRKLFDEIEAKLKEKNT
jgi:hypothetical protein